MEGVPIVTVEEIEQNKFLFRFADEDMSTLTLTNIEDDEVKITTSAVTVLAGLCKIAVGQFFMAKTIEFRNKNDYSQRTHRKIKKWIINFLEKLIIKKN